VVTCAPSAVLDSYEAYGCRVNALEPHELFARYAEAGFLYEAKRERLRPFLPTIEDNWRRALRAGELIHWVATHDQPQLGSWASISSWRSTHRGWNTQHLVSVGGPSGSRAVMLAGQAVRIRDAADNAHQNWFRPDNRFPKRVFGSIETGVGGDHAAVVPQTLLSIPTGVAAGLAADLRISRQREPWQADLYGLAVAARGRVYAEAEELDHEDLELDTVDQLYGLVGLRRYRHIWLTWERDRLLGAAIAWRGPLGFNFSFLENRCDLLLRPGLEAGKAAGVVRALLRAASGTYADLPLGAIPVVARCNEADHVLAAGGDRVRDYTQSIWLQPAFPAMYAHMARFYERIERASHRAGLATAAAPS
jgi:hypothetical protein